MNNWQNLVLVLFLVYSLAGFFYGLKYKKNPYGLCKRFTLIGAFVWTDAFIFGLFFSLISILCLLLQQWVLFGLIYSVFWLVRSIGEQIYWFHEQFAVSHRNSPHTLLPSKLFKGEEVWIVMQTFWQCVSVVSVVASVYIVSFVL